MIVKEIMTREVEVVQPEDTVLHAAQLMKQMDVGSLPVCDGQRLVGMLTDRDITVVATAEGIDPGSTPVGDIMTPDVIYCYEDDSIEEAASVMEEKQVRRLIVLDRKKQMAGVLTIGDIAEKTGDQTLKGEVLEGVSQPAGYAHPAEPKRQKTPEIPSETHL